MNDATTVRPFSWAVWIGGLLVALFIGCILNVCAGFFALASESRLIASLVGVTPGFALGLVAFLVRRREHSFALGLFTGACVVALAGGLCSFALVGQQIGG